ncbi:Ima1 N-terminal domain-containing protein [Plectosphaerella plurivora]|uniref:Ima1 N-terminal domain-containing protein n=1 Tax=Plectosphaerella plurivora TaxID=936078 RepID=A0A9P8VIZ1_9PEZI|nr:Ima1 N-terminal domain-containing protein [Plectosphaerella plurivora]
MPRLGGSLSCFYCGKKSSVKFDGSIRDFVCLHCDATNYLDENGEITDPPVAKTTTAVEPAQYATIRQQPPVAATSSSQDIFCSTCQKNQHLFTASLAQYLPDDPDHPDYARLERDYYKYRKSLEQLYPQICADCFPKVQAQVDKAGYTARTDHLRRMMDKSRQRRATPKQWSPLDTIDTMGKWLWLSGLAAQLLWHLVLVSQASSSTSGSLRDPDEVPHWFSVWLAQVTLRLPAAQSLISWSIYVTLIGIWWNPRFVQVFRGFSKHVLGLSQWYAFQGLILAVRLGGREAAGHVAQSEVATSAKVSLHGLLAIITIACYWKGQTSVHIDTTPLFQSDTTPMPTPPRVKGPTKAVQKEDTQSLAGILDEIMHQQPAQQVMEIPTRSTRSPLAQSAGQGKGNIGMGGLALSERPPQYSEEMDWSPTQSKHRAFNDFGAPGRDKQGFNAAPANVDSGAFWYKVPPAPKAPLHKLATASTAVIREKPAESSSNFFLGRASNSAKPGVSGSIADNSKVDFAQPSFFAAPNSNNDPRNTLADILDSKFKLSLDDASDEGRTNSVNNQRKPYVKNTWGRFFDVILHAALLNNWWGATAYEETQPFTRRSMIITMTLAMLVNLHMLYTAITDLQVSIRKRKTLKGNVFLSVCEVITCGLLMIQIRTTPNARLLFDMRQTGIISMMIMGAHATAVYLGPMAVDDWTE